MNPSLLHVPTIYREIYLDHWDIIKTSVKKGVHKDVYHFPILSSSNITEFLNIIREATRGYFEINVSFGFIIKNPTTKELRFCHPASNSVLFKTSRLIYDSYDFKSLIEDLEALDILEYARLQIPSPRWTIERFICVRFVVYRF